ncbi:MAG: RtcB family protein [Euryarchaeota archaeon]|nr:RtcB family protein [Euryarchaeota archaeon]
MPEWKGPLKQLDEFRYEIPKSYKPTMRTDGLLFVDSKMLPSVLQDQAPEQVANVATMPGIIGNAMAMPDIHWGYGFPIGGVAAFDINDGVISPGGIGYDINCGVRLIRTDLEERDIRPNLKELVDTMFVNVPSGVGSEGKVSLSRSDLEKIMTEGVRWAVDHGYGWSDDVDRIEARGCLPDADPSKVGPKPRERGIDQVGSLGAGNHFLEIQKVDKVYDERAAKALGIDRVGQVCIMIHTGSRGFGHQIATDYIRIHEDAVDKYKIALPDRQLACAPISSSEGQNYWRAMCCGANFAWTNRQLITHWTRESFQKVLGRSAAQLGMEIVYDVCHNIGKIEEHDVGGQRHKVLVHRKGATRAFPPGHPESPAKYKDVGQPVLIPGDMGTCSFVLVGLPTAMTVSFGSSCHGAGRQMSRAAATRKYRANEVATALAGKGIYLHAASKAGIVEEAPGAYKNVEDVVRVAEGAGLTKVVARVVPLGVVKG